MIAQKENIDLVSVVESAGLRLRRRGKQLLYMLPAWEYHMDILISGDDELKFELYLDYKDKGEI